MTRRSILALVAVLLLAVPLSALVAGCDTGKRKLTVAEVKPARGPYYGGDDVRIYGSGFQTPAPQGVKVYFGKKAVKNLIIISDTEMKVAPPGGDINEEVEVEVIFDDSRSAKLPMKYKYIEPNIKQQ